MTLTEKSHLENPLILKPNEVLDDDRLEKSMVYLLKENEKTLKLYIEKEVGVDKIKEIKAVDDLIRNIKGLLSFDGLKRISDAIISKNFIKGWDSAEKQMEMNVSFNQKALEFLQNYTFENIKGMTEEITNDLRQELQRGIINGEGLVKLKDRVSSVMDIGENRAQMIARTETNRAENNGKLLAVKGSGLDYKKKWISAEDERTSDICNHLDNDIIGLNDEWRNKKCRAVI